MAVVTDPITVSVWNSTYTTKLADLNAKDPHVQVELGEAGSGRCQVNRTDPNLTHVKAFNILRFGIGSTPIHSVLLGPYDQQTIRDRRATEDRTIGGAGLLDILRYGLVYPEPGYPSHLRPSQRPFNWLSKHFIAPPGWVEPFGIKQQGSNVGSAELLAGQWDLAPSPWGGPTVAYWMWPQDQDDDVAPPQPVGSSLFRSQITLEEEMDLLWFLSADDGFRYWFGTQLIGQDTEAYGWRGQKAYAKHVEAGTFQIAIEGINIDRPTNEATNVAGVLFAMYRTTAGGVPTELLLYSDLESWTSIGYPTEPQGMTKGRIVGLLCDEWEARGGPTIARTFDDDLDSDGGDWGIVDLTVPVRSTTILDVVRKLTELGASFAMDASSLTLHGWEQRGTDKTAIVLNRCEQLVHRQIARQANVLLAGYADEQLIEVTDDDSITEVGYRLEVGGELGGAATDLAATPQAEAALARLAETRQATATPIPDTDAVPLIDFDLGDTVTMLDEQLDEVEERVVRVTYTGDVNGFPRATVDT